MVVTGAEVGMFVRSDEDYCLVGGISWRRMVATVAMVPVGMFACVVRIVAIQEGWIKGYIVLLYR
jgi:hypothetical protein